MQAKSCVPTEAHNYLLSFNIILSNKNQVELGEDYSCKSSMFNMGYATAGYGLRGTVPAKCVMSSRLY